MTNPVVLVAANLLWIAVAALAFTVRWQFRREVEDFKRTWGPEGASVAAERVILAEKLERAREALVDIAAAPTLRPAADDPLAYVSVAGVSEVRLALHTCILRARDALDDTVGPGQSARRGA